MKLLRAIEEWFRDKETEHKIELVHRYNRILQMKLKRGDFNYKA